MQNNVAGALECWVVPANGCANVLVIEGESAPGKGSAGKSMGRARAQFSTPVSIQSALYSIPFYAEFNSAWAVTTDRKATCFVPRRINRRRICAPITPGK
jgi:hypothetical protein